MLVWLVLALCAIGVVSGPTEVTGYKNRRESFKILTEKSDRESYIAMAAAELPIIGPGSNLPVLVLPVVVNSKDPDYKERADELISLRNVKYSLAPQYVLLGNQEDRMRSRVRYITVETQSEEDYDDPIIIAEPSPPENNYPVYRPTSRMRKKFVIKISPRQNLRVYENVVSSTTPSRDYIPVSEIPTTTPSREYIPVTDNVLTTPSQQFEPPFTQNIVPSTPPPNHLTYVAGDVILNTPAPQKEWRLVGNVVSITPPPKNINYITNNVFTIREDLESVEDTSEQPKNRLDITFHRNKEQSPNINSERPKNESLIPSDRPKDQSPIPYDRPKVQSPNITSERPKDKSPISSDRPKDQSPISSAHLKDQSPILHDRPEDQSPNIASERPKDQSPIPSARPKDQSQNITSESPKNKSPIPSDQPKGHSPNITSERPKDKSPIPSDQPKGQSPDITSEHPKNQPPVPSYRSKTPWNFIWNMFNDQFSSPENRTIDELSTPQNTAEPTPKGLDNLTPTVTPSDPLKTPSVSLETPNKGLEKPTVTEKPDTSSSSRPTPKPDSPTTTKRPSKPKTPPQTGRHRRDVYIPFAHGLEHIFDTTREMITNYQREKPYNPELPAVLPSGRKFPKRIPNEKDNPFQVTISGPSPAQPRFKQSMRLRIDIKVPRSDYTEAYDLQWHAGTNTARTVVEDGATIFYRMPLFDGRMQYLKFKVDTRGGNATGHCTLSPLFSASPRDQEFPGLPDLTPFQFIGYTESEEQPLVERWRHWVIGKPGQDGAAIGESLNYTHDFLLYRDRGRPMPIKYTVVTHSSVLGPYSDTYTHRYSILQAPTGPMLPDRNKLCQIMEHVKIEPLLKPQLRDSTTKAPREIPPPDDDLPSDNEDITPNPILGTEGLEAEAVNKGDIAANINIGTDHGANLASGREEVVANINIGAGDHVTHRRIVANINIGAGLGTRKDSRGIANLSFGTVGLNDRLEGGANLNFGTKDIGTELSSESSKGLANLNFGTRHRGTGVGLDKQGEDENRNFGKGGRRDWVELDKEGVNVNRQFGKGDRRYGVDLDKVGLNGHKNVDEGGREADKGDIDENINIEKGSRDNGVGLDKTGEEENVSFGKGGGGFGILNVVKEGIDENKNFGNEGRGTRVGLDKEDVDKNINSGKISVGAGEVSIENVNRNTDFREESFGAGKTSDKGKTDPNFGLGTGGSEGGGTSDKGGVDKNLNNGIEGVSTKVVDKEVNLKNKTGDRNKTVGENELSKADSAVKDSFNPIRDFLGSTKAKKYDDLFEQYKKKFKRKYKDDGEEAVRKAQFIKTLRYVEAANRIATKFKLGINYMSDRLKDELRPMVSGVPPDDLDNIAPGATGGPERQYEEEFKTARTIEAKVAEKDFPSSFSWHDKGFNTEVRHQGVNCLSCSLMATTGAVEGLLFAKMSENKLLSPQIILDCGEMFDPMGLKWCAATFPRDAYKFIKEKGLPSDDQYKFVTPPKMPMCKDDVMSAAKIKDFYNLRRDAEPSHLRLAIKTRSPVVVVFKVLTGSSPQHYEEGILDDKRWCDGAKDRHSVVAVGFDFSVPGQEHFIFKNSWGADWGEKGYAKIKSGACDILTDVSYPVL